MSARGQKSRRANFAFIFGITFVIFLIVPLLLLLGWEFIRYEGGQGFGFLVHVNRWIVGAALAALATATVSAIFRRVPKQ